MATEIKLPRLGQGMESGTIVKWLKSEGDQVEKGEPLYELDTDKVTQEVEADASGVLLKIAVAEGEVEVGKTIAVIGEEGEKVDQPAEPSGEAVPELSEDEQQEGSPARAREQERERGRRASAEPAEQVSEIKAPSGNGRIKASQLARRSPLQPRRRRASRSRSCRRCGRRSHGGSRRPGRPRSSSWASPWTWAARSSYANASWSCTATASSRRSPTS